MSSITATGFPTEALRSALATSLATGAFSDVAYHLYSRRLSDGRIGVPQVVYVSSVVLKAAGEYFVAQLDGGFTTNQRMDNDTDAYSYDEDSDIEDAEDEDAEFSQVNDEDGAADSKNKGKEETPAAESTSPPFLRNEKDTKFNIVVPDVAANTWRALMFYIYTGKVNFAPLRSQKNALRTLALLEHRLRNPDLPALCSPKSMYRLADIIGLDGLKQLAKHEIERKMSSQTIIDEVFCRFSSFYPDVLTMQLDFLYTNALMSQVIPAVQQKLKEIAEGHMPHAENILGALVMKLSLLLAVQHPSIVLPRDRDGRESVSSHYISRSRCLESSDIAPREEMVS